MFAGCVIHYFNVYKNVAKEKQQVKKLEGTVAQSISNNVTPTNSPIHLLADSRSSWYAQVTHIVIPQEFFVDDSFISTVQGLGAYVLYHGWIVESIAASKRLPESDYYVPGLTQVNFIV